MLLLNFDLSFEGVYLLIIVLSSVVVVCIEVGKGVFCVGCWLFW